MFQHIDSKKAGRSYKCCDGHPQGRALGAVQQRLLAATDRYIASRRFWAAYGDNTPDVMSLRHQSAIWALVAVKRDLQRAI
jgi:hypothetical protein